VIAVTDWERSNRFYADVLGAEVVLHGAGYAYRLGEQQLNVHGPGVEPDPIARVPVVPGGGDLCFAWPVTVLPAREHLERHCVVVELGRVSR
jgi:catechol 2,3-dioxygenase-like lactoylglutathione lyase family enzyme